MFFQSILVLFLLLLLNKYQIDKIQSIWESCLHKYYFKYLFTLKAIRTILF